MTRLLLLIAALCLGSVFADINKCGEITDDKTIYTTFFDASNGHNLLGVTLTTDASSGYTWEDIVADTDKWDDNKPFVYGTVTIGSDAPLACQVERRGDWSSESDLPSLKIKFTGAKVEWKGMDRILMNKHPWDTTRVRSKLTYELLQQVPNMASQFTQFSTLTVNGQTYGLYTLLEDMDTHMLKTHKLGKKSYMYKSNQVSWNLEQDTGVKQITDADYLKTDFESNWDIRGKEDHKTLINAYEQIYDANLGNRAVMETVFNVDNFATWLAVMYLAGQHDLVFNNYGVYAPNENGACAFPTPFYMIAWDNDGAWDDNFFSSSSVAGQTYPFYYQGLQYFWDVRPVKRFLQVPTYVDLLKTKMDALINGAMSASTISSLTSQYKTIIKPILSQEPDLSNIAFDASIEDWLSAVDKMSTYPTVQYQAWTDNMNNPMPVNQYMTPMADGSSFFFYWDPSYVMYGKPFYYDFYVASEPTFDNNTTPYVYWISTRNNFASVPSSSLSPSTVYYYRVTVRNFLNPAKYFTDAYQSLSDDSGFGVSTFTTPSSLSSTLPSAATPTIANIKVYEDPAGANSTSGISSYRYATLDDVDPSAASSACSTTPLSIPEGWIIAPNNQLVMSHISALNLPWGGSYLVLRDGAKLDARTGQRLEGFGDHVQHLMATVSQEGSMAYFPDCSAQNNGRILLADPSTLDYVDEDPQPQDSTGSAAMLTSSVLMIAFVVIALMF